MTNALNPAGTLRSFVILLGEYFAFVGRALSSIHFLWRRRSLFFRQCDFIGVTSLGIVVVAGIFLGAVLGYQLYVSLHLFGAEALLGGSVGMALFRELGPVMTAVMVTGRAGAAMAAELASMRISEQIDALEVMGVDPYEYLITPRLIAGLVMLPLLGVIFSIVATLAAMGIACGVMDLSVPVFMEQFRKTLDPMDIGIHCMPKSAAFGFILASVSSFFGFRAIGGARAVGLSARSAVVASCLSILLADYLLTSMLPFGYAWLKVNG